MRVAPESNSRLGEDPLPRCTCRGLLRHLWSFITIKEWLPTYSWRHSLLRDCLAGITVGVIAVPQSMSYATVAGLPAKYGLYNSLIGLLLYPVFGTSPHLITGPTAVMSILVSGLIPSAPFHNPTYEVNGTMFPIQTGPEACSDEFSPDCSVRIALMMCLSFVSGLMQVLLGAGKLGFLVDLISEPVIIGFTTGSAFLIAGTQITSFLNIPKCGDKGAAACWSDLGFVDTVANVFQEWSKIDMTTVFYGVVCLCILFFFQDGWTKVVDKFQLNKGLNFLSRLGPLFVLVVSIILMAETGGSETTKENRWGIKIVGSVCDQINKYIHPECFPPFIFPFAFSADVYYIRFGDILTLLGPAFTVALVGFMEAISIAKTVATQEARKKMVRPKSNQIVNLWLWECAT